MEHHDYLPQLTEHLNKYGIIHRMQLDELGIDYRAKARLVRQGLLQKIRPSIYADGRHPDSVIAAHRHGGRLTCWQLLVALGAWQPPVSDSRAHYALAKGQHKPHMNAHWHRSKVAGIQVYEPIPQALVHLVECLGSTSPAWAVGVLDSALHAGIITRGDLKLAERSGAGRDLLLHLHSGTVRFFDTILAVHLNNHRIRYQTGIRIGRLRASFLAADKVVINVASDGDQIGDAIYNSETSGKLAVLGYQYLSVTETEVLHSPEYVIAKVMRAISGHREVA